MKNLKYILFLILPLFAFYGCEDDDGSNPGFGEKEIPHIYVTWSENMAYKVGDIVSIEPQISPSDGATYKWTLNGEVISTEKDLSYRIPDYLVGVLKFEVTRNEVSNSRTANLLVPQPFKPKTYNKKAIAFLTENGSISDVDWENITHLVVSSAEIGKDGAIKTTFVDKINPSVLSQFAHHYGVYVLMEASGVLKSYLNAAPLYGSYTFYNAAIGDKQVDLAKNIIAKADELGFDGINIYMDKANTDNGLFGEPAKLKAFYEAVAANVTETKNIDGEDYPYLLTMSVVGGWTRGSLAGVVNIARYDWVNVLAFGAEDLDAVPHSAQWYAEQEVGVWLGWQGPIAPSRVVLGVPAFGLRYFGVPAGYAWDNLENFTEYISYKDICSKHSDAPSKSVVVIKENNGDKSKEVDKIFYDGLSNIEQKAEYAKSKDLAGMALWSIESDSKQSGQSLMKKINESLGN